MDRLKNFQGERYDACEALKHSADDGNNAVNLVVSEMEKFHKKLPTAGMAFVKFTEDEAGRVWITANLISDKETHTVTVSKAALTDFVFTINRTESCTALDAYETFENGSRIWYFEYRF